MYRSEKRMKGFIFIKNTLILTVTSLLLRLAGMIFKVWTSSAVGAEGVGLYQQILSVYILAATFASSGICTGVTRLISEQTKTTRASASAVLRKATLLTLAASVVLGGGLFFAAPFVSKYILGDPRTALSIKILCFSLPFKGTAACVKGYYYAKRKTVQPSLCQLFEQFVRIAVTVFFVGKFAGLGVEMLTAALLIGDTVGEISSFIYIYIAYKFEKRRLPSGGGAQKGILREILRIALPITGSRYIMSGLHTAESAIVPAQLTSFAHSRSTALAQFGMLKGMALPLVFFPASFLSALSVMLLPEMSQAAAVGNKRKIKEITRRSIGTTLIAATVVAGIFFFNAKPIGILIFGSQEVGYMIRMLSPIIPFMYLESVADGMLKGLDQQTSSLFYNVADSLCRLILIFLIVSRTGITGFLVIMIISNITTSSLNTARLIKVTESGFDLKNWVLKPLAATVVGGAAGYVAVLWLGFGGLLSTVVSVGLQAAVSFLMLIVLGCIKPFKITEMLGIKNFQKNFKNSIDK